MKNFRRDVAPFAILSAGFALSQAYRTLPAITAQGISAQFGAGDRAIGIYAATFHLAFALMQIPAGVALDRWGPRNTVFGLAVLSIVGAAICTMAPAMPVLLLGQALVGMGCAPALTGAIVLLGRTHSGSQFARISGLIFAVGGLGMLATATPLAWLVDLTNWRASFAVLAVLSIVTAGLCWMFVPPEPDAPDRQHQSLGPALAGIVDVLRQPQSKGILALGLASYAVAITVRGLWIVPLFTNRHGMSLLASGNIVLAVSIAMLVTPMAFGWADRGGQSRLRLICAASAGTCLTLVAFAWGGLSTEGDVILAVVFGMLSSFQVLQYTDVQVSYPPELIGRATATFNMSVFIGVALIQASSGLIAHSAPSLGVTSLTAVFIWLALALAVGTLLFAVLPRGTRGQQRLGQESPAAEAAGR